MTQEKPMRIRTLLATVFAGLPALAFAGAAALFA
jgi:hypothetical protein